MCVSHDRIYQHIDQDKAQGGDLVKFLRCQKVRLKRYASGHDGRGVLKNRIGIDQRPSIVDRRSRIGDWEGDTVIGKGHQGVQGPDVTQAVIDLLRSHNHKCKTLTFDNDKEFAEHEFIA